MTAIYRLVRVDGRVGYQGTFPERYRLVGVEESHHAIFQQRKGTHEQVNPLLEDVATYDAREWEYRALVWQLRHAREQGMTSVTVEGLERRLSEAKRHREHQRESKPGSNQHEESRDKLTT